MSRHISKKPYACQAFTLVELLVVIGIIAVLISVLLPALSKARQTAESSRCLSNLRAVGQAAMIYAAEYKGWFPPGHASNRSGAGFSISRTDSAFVDYGGIASTTDNPNRWIVAEAMARCAGYKFKPYDATKSLAQNVADGYVAVRTPIFFCPTNFQPVPGSGAEAFPDYNLLNHDPSVVGNNGNAITKMSYLWVANPWHSVSPTEISAIGGQEDLLAANVTLPANGNGGFCHMDLDPDQINVVDFDTSRPCKPGFDYLRRTSDKNAAKVAICVDNARQQGSGFFFYPHGNMKGWYNKDMPGPKNAAGGPYKLTIAPQAWFNELFGDGHAESRRGDQLRFRWASTNPQVW